MLNLNFSCTIVGLHYISGSIYFKMCNSQLKRLEINETINHNTFSVSEIEVFHLRWFLCLNEEIGRHRNSTPRRSGMNICIFGCVTEFCMQRRVCVTLAENVGHRVSISRWQRRTIDVSHKRITTLCDFWRMENAELLSDAHLKQGGNTLRSLPRSRYFVEVWSSRGCSQMNCAQESGSWSNSVDHAKILTHRRCDGQWSTTLRRNLRVLATAAVVYSEDQYGNGYT